MYVCEYFTYIMVHMYHIHVNKKNFYELSRNNEEIKKFWLRCLFMVHVAMVHHFTPLKIVFPLVVCDFSFINSSSLCILHF